MTVGSTVGNASWLSPGCTTLYWPVGHGFGGALLLIKVFPFAVTPGDTEIKTANIPTRTMNAYCLSI